MNKIIPFLTGFLFVCFLSSAQTPNGRLLFVIDSIPILNDPEDWNQLLQEDISDSRILRDKDSLRVLGWGELDGINYIFTKAYRSRPDSLKRIPSLKQMIMKDNAWTLHGLPYSGRYIDYYNSGHKQNEGELLYGKLDGTLTVYFKNGTKKSVANYRQGTRDGAWNDYYKNGAIMQTREFLNGAATRTGKLYFINGQLQQELRLKNQTRYDTSVIYYSTGKIKQWRLMKDAMAVADKKEESLNYYTPKFNQSLNTGDLKEANKDFFKIWLLDSNSTDTHFFEGMLLARESRFDDAIVAFDKALEIEPLMREAWLHRGIARLKKNQFLRAKIFTKDSRDIPFTIEDLVAIATDEQKKICYDLHQADLLDFSEFYVIKWIPPAILSYCGEKENR